MKQTIILDFDDTIFNTVLFKRDSLMLIARKTKLDFDLCLKYFLIFSKKQRSYTWQTFVEYVAQKEKVESFDTSFLYNKNLKKYVTKKDRLFLKSLSEEYNLVLLTQGDKKNQRLKIVNSETEKLFSKIYIVQNSKKDFLVKHKKFQKSIFINDKKNENKEISELFPFLRVYHFTGYVLSLAPAQCTILNSLHDIKKLKLA